MASNVQESSHAKRPCKGILKNSGNYQKHGTSVVKAMKFDESNVQKTFHPANKDYGHMKIDEPKTPYNYTSSEHSDELDAELLAEKLRDAIAHLSDSEDDLSEEETPEKMEKRLDFEKRRKMHYKEFEAVKMARELIRKDEEMEEDNEDGRGDTEMLSAAAHGSPK